MKSAFEKLVDKNPCEFGSESDRKLWLAALRWALRRCKNRPYPIILARKEIRAEIKKVEAVK